MNAEPNITEQEAQQLTEGCQNAFSNPEADRFVDEVLDLVPDFQRRMAAARAQET